MAKAFRLLGVLAISVLLVAPAIAEAGSKKQDKKEFDEFKQLVGDFSRAEQIDSWEAFIKKYPNNRYVKQARVILSELRGQKKSKRVAKATPATKTPRKANRVKGTKMSADPDLDFLTDAAKPYKGSGESEVSDNDWESGSTASKDLGDPFAGIPEEAAAESSGSSADDPFQFAPKAPRLSAKERKKRDREARQAAARELQQKKRIAAEKAERKRRERERIAAAKAEKERKERERQERIAAKAERERKERARAERERIAAAKAERERKQRERDAAAKAERERKDRERIARQQADQERQEREAAEKMLREMRQKSERKEAAVAKKQPERSDDFMASLTGESKSSPEPVAADEFDPFVDAPAEPKIRERAAPVRAAPAPEPVAVRDAPAQKPASQDFEFDPFQVDPKDAGKERRRLEKQVKDQKKAEARERKRQEKALAKMRKKAAKIDAKEGKTPRAKKQKATKKKAVVVADARPVDPFAPRRTVNRPSVDTLGATRSSASFRSGDRALRVEVAPFVGLAPDEVYIRNMQAGATAGVHVGRYVVLEGEAAVAISSETPLLTELRGIDAEPEVLSTNKYRVGGGLAINLVSSGNELLGASMRNDFFVRAGGGIVNTDLEICYENEGVKCPEPVYITGANFVYLNAGIGHRFYVMRWLALRTDVRYGTVLELIDGVTTPRSNFQLNLGASLVF